MSKSQAPETAKWRRDGQGWRIGRVGAVVGAYRIKVQLGRQTGKWYATAWAPKRRDPGFPSPLTTYLPGRRFHLTEAEAIERCERWLASRSRPPRKGAR